ncbi:MAG: flavodoxin family protein [Firmicutes bacterium]|nr:flavodoxin family protein [Bacillota bacterium]
MSENLRLTKKKCLALACSPRLGGNTALLAERALEACREAGHETELLQLTKFNYAPCRACDACFATGICAVGDDAGVIFEKILAADLFIMAAPVFSMGVCAQAKMLIDRAQRFWAARYVLHIPVGEPGRTRHGMFVSCAGSDLPGVFDGTLRTVRYFFMMLGIKLDGTLCYQKVDKKGDILQHPQSMDEVYQQARTLALA